MCFALRHDIWASPDSEALSSNDAQHSGICDTKGADQASSTTTDDERLPKLTPPSDKPNIGIESEDIESAVEEVMHGECMDVVLYVPISRQTGTETSAQDDTSATVAEDSADGSGGADGDAMDLDPPEPINRGDTAIAVENEVTVPSGADILQSAVQTEDQPKVAIYDGAQDGTMSIQSILEETASRRMMRSGVEPTAVDDSTIVLLTVASAGQSSSGDTSPVTTTSTTPLVVQDVSETAVNPGEVDNLVIDSTALAAPVATQGRSEGHALPPPTDELPAVQTTTFEAMPGLSIPIADMKGLMRDYPHSRSGFTEAYPVDLCTPQSDAVTPRASPADLCKTSVTDLDEVMNISDNSPVPLNRISGEIAPKPAMPHISASIENVTSGGKASKIKVSKPNGTKEIEAPAAKSTKRKAPEPASMEPPAKKLKSTAPAPPTKTASSTASKKSPLGGMTKTIAKKPASKAASQSPEVVMIDSGPSTPASQSGTPPPKPIASNSKRPASGRSGKSVGTHSATKNGVEKTSIAATAPKPKAIVADTKKPTARKNDKVTLTPSVAKDDAVQVSLVAKPKSKTATATAKEVTPSQTASKTATPSVAEDDDFEDEDEDEDDEPSSEAGNQDIQTPAKPVCSRCKALMRKELKGAHDKAMKALKKAHETALEAQKKKLTQNASDQKVGLGKKAKVAADSHEKAMEKLKARLEKVEEAHKDKVEDLKDKHETKVESLTAERDDAVNKRREVEKAAATALRQHKEAMAKKDAKLKEDTQKIKDAKRTEIDEMKPELNAAMRDKMREIRELTVNKERLEKALSESTADAEAQSKAAEKWQMDYTASERRKLRAKKRVEDLEGELDAIRKSGLGPNPNVSAMREDYEDELKEMRGRVDRARRNEVESGHRVVAEQRALFSMRAANERHKAKADKAEEKAAKAELENRVLKGMLVRLSGGGGGRADVEMSG
ncbi:hypothetical protein LTR95_012230 [Oleoguttula sp. CCFEE 5521]